MSDRALLERLYAAAVEAADPDRAVKSAMRDHPVPETAGALTVIAFGKAAPAMMRAALACLPTPRAALVVTHHENSTTLPGVETIRAGHPVPDEHGLRAGQRIMELLAETGPGDRVVVLVSGGGSALVPAPAGGLSLADKQAVNRALLEAGLDITAMNLVRQQLSELKGGGLLRHAAPASVHAYILSDVIGDDLRAIASGPTASPLGTRAEAKALLEVADAWDKLPARVRDLLSAPDETVEMPEADNILVGSNRQSLAAMVEAAPEGIETRIVSDHLVGDVAEACAEIVAAAKTAPLPCLLIFGGETTVRIAGTGTGGRNQELALRIAFEDLPGTWTFLSGGTDGRDGPTDAAGGIVDAGTLQRIRDAGQDPQALLANNDSHAALEAAGDLLRVPATGTNVADVQALLIRA
ncbi:glycerate kinase type-2 family protein [Mesobacterium pallidum]|uniref:glycerate kinase type-2 family protein n=1 Tax=Mesobacterium pallidum TaxID=2872037 RepID=UPI001EE21052|nr:DUF4147 domain-containing protein [Mesobacterium pallidum]